MVALFKKLSIFFLSIYIMSLYIFQYNVELNVISHILFVIFIGISCAYIFLRGEFILSSSYINYFTLGFLALISYFWALDKSIVLVRNKTLFILIALSIFIINVINDEESLKQCLKAIYIGGMIMCLYSLFYYGLNITISSLQTGDRLGGEINQENLFGIYSGITFIISLYYALYEKKKVCYILSILPFIYAISSGSRKAIIIIVIGIGILLCYKITSKKILNILIISLLSIVLLYIVYYFSFNIKILDRFRFLINFVLGKNDFVDNSILTRYQMIKIGIEAFLKNPILGYGTEQYNMIYYNIFSTHRPSHNSFIQVLVDYGIVGFVIYYGMFYKIIRNCFINLKEHKNISVLLLTIIFICLANQFAANLFFDKLTIIFISLGFSYINIFKKNKGQENNISIDDEDFLGRNENESIN